jgi:hypothetical protein
MFEKLIVAEMKTNLFFVEHGGSLPCFQALVIRLYPKPAESGSHTRPLFISDPL